MIRNLGDHSANERTFLAWVRTSVAIMAFGFLVEKFDLFLAIAGQTLDPSYHLPDRRFGNIVGLILIILGVAMIAIATLRFRRTAKAIDSAETSASPEFAGGFRAGPAADPVGPLTVRLPRSRTGNGSLSRVFLFVAALAGMMGTAGLAYGASAPAGTASETTFLVQIVVLILLGRVLGEIMQRIGQPSVMGQLLAGLILGPSFLGAFWPDLQHALFPPSHEQKSMIDGVSQIGILLLLLLTGMETDLKLVRRIGRAAVSVSVTGIVLPFICGFFLGQYLPDSLLPDPAQRLIGSLFLGTALSISSVKIVAMVVREMNFMRRNVGQIIIASAIVDDTIGWIIIAVIFSLAQHGTIDALSVGKSVAGTLVFLAVSLTIGRRFVFWLIRWTNDNMVSEVPVIFVILVLMGGMALITQWIGVHTVLGAFVAGILVGESPILTKHIDEELRGLIMGLFMPVFFGLAGLSADLTILRDPTLLALTAGLIVIASIGKFTGAFAGGVLGRLSARESMALGCGMNARGLDRGDHCHHRAFHGRVEPEPLHHDRDHGGGHHHGHAADAALGPDAPAHERG